MSISQEAKLSLLGWSFRGAGVSVRERVAFTADEIREALTKLSSGGVISEGVIVSTCHRSEIYSFVADDGARTALTRFVSEWRGLDQAELEGSSFYRSGGDAARHLFRVAAGLDSLALGESEVLGQVRQALSLARESGTTRAVMHRLFESAVAAGKRVRTETEISRHPLSVSSIGFELARKVFGDFSRHRVLVIGAGETGSLFARHAVEAGVREPVIVNRTLSRAQELASGIRGRAVPWESLAGEVPQADVVVSATSSPGHVVTRPAVEAAMRERRGRPMMFLDLAVPRDIAPDVSEVYNVYSYSIDDLEEVAKENRARRAREVPLAEKIVEEELETYLAWLGNLSVVPTVIQWRNHLDHLRDLELERAPAAERERLKGQLDAFSSRILFEPMKRLKGEGDAARKLDRVEAVRHLFDLDKE
ncbi:MAG TPA: glutamyl-tRNA reductase [Thermoanaerobaculia bacterium]|nr:glutamyl-tRNA reductase [Thermoanaerobaculia bacterium]